METSLALSIAAVGGDQVCGASAATVAAEKFLQRYAFDEIGEAFARAGIVCVKGHECVDDCEGTGGGDFVIHEGFGEAGIGAAATADENGPTGFSADECDVLDAGFGAFVGASGDADFEFSGEGSAVVACIDFESDLERVLQGAFAELCSGAGFDGADDLADHVSRGRLAEFSPDGIEVVFLQADDGDALGGCAFDSLGVIFFGDVGEFAEHLGRDDAAGEGGATA